MKKLSIFIVVFLASLTNYSQETETHVFESKSTCTQSLSGVVKNVKTGELIPNALVQLYDRGELVSSIEAGEDATFHFTLDCGKRYNINARSENFTINSKIVYASSKGGEKNLDLMLYPIKEFINKDTNKLIDVENVYFETDGETIGEFTSEQLKKVANIMKKYPEIRVSVDVHTDSKGEEEYSLNITKERADAIVNYLIEKGIAADRLEANGYGDTQLINHCAKDVKCTEAEHRANRRIEFVVMQ
jgi:outer membrane protein OmpA-like peptidoglycan-associated protein